MTNTHDLTVRFLGVRGSIGRHIALHHSKVEGSAVLDLAGLEQIRDQAIRELKDGALIREAKVDTKKPQAKT